MKKKTLLLLSAMILLLATGNVLHGQVKTAYGVMFIPETGDSVYYTPQDTNVIIGKFTLKNKGKLPVDIVEMTVENTQGSVNLFHVELFSNNEAVGMVEITSNQIRFFSYPGTLLVLDPKEKKTFEIRARQTFYSQEIELWLKEIVTSVQKTKSDRVSLQTEELSFPEVTPKITMCYYFLSGGIEPMELQIIRSDNFPEGGIVVAGDGDIEVLRWIFDNIDGPEGELLSVTVKIEGTGNAVNYSNFTAAIFIDGIQQGSARNFDSNGIAIFNDLVSIIPEGAISEEFTLVVNTIGPSAPGTMKYSILDVLVEDFENDIPITTFNGVDPLSVDNPLEGALFELIIGATVTYEINTFIPGVDIFENTVDNNVINIRFYATGDSAAIKDLYFENFLDPEIASRGDWKLYDENGEFLQIKQMIGDIVHFELNNPNRIVIPNGGFTDAWLKFDARDITDPSQSGHNFQMDLSEIEGRTLTTGENLVPENISGTATSEVFTLLMDPSRAVGINSIPYANGNGIKIYPNPAKDFLNITPIKDIVRIVILNSLGEVVFSTTAPIDNINVSSFDLGLYFIQLHMKSGEIVLKKLIKH